MSEDIKNNGIIPEDELNVTTPAEPALTEDTVPSEKEGGKDKKDRKSKKEHVRTRVPKSEGIVNVDAEGNVIGEAFPISKSVKRDHQKTSVMYTALAFLLHLIAIVPLVAIPIFLASKSYGLLPSYGFWHFIGFILLAVFGLIYAAVAFTVTRKSSKSSIMGQTVKIVITYVCLTTVFGLILTYIVPDIIAKATSSTLYAEDLFYLGSEQVDENAALERQFLMYNVLNGNMNAYDKETGLVKEYGDFSYATLERHDTTQSGGVLNYLVPEIAEGFASYTELSRVAGTDRYSISALDDLLAQMQSDDPYKYELYNFIYKTYVLNDFDYALSSDDRGIVSRRSVALSITDYIYKYADYERLVAEGFLNPKLKQLFQNNYDNFNQDGYQPFDDPLLLYAQLNGRMTIPVVLRLILNKGWSYTQPEIDDQSGSGGESKLYYTEDNSFLYEHYEPQTLSAYRAANPDKSDDELFPYADKLMSSDGGEYDARYGFNADGWKVYINGVVRRPITWLVLDMLGDPMSITSVDLSDVGFDISLNESTSLHLTILDILSIVEAVPGLYDSLGELLKVDVEKLINTATNGAGLSIGVYIDDAQQLQLQIMPMNTDYGMLGYMQATWMQSNNLLMAVINVLNLRNWLYIFGGIGAILVVAAGVLRECGKRTRMRAAIARDRILRASAQPVGDLDEAQARLDEQKRQKELSPKIEQAKINVLRAQDDLDHIEDEEYLKEAKKKRKQEDKQRKAKGKNQNSGKPQQSAAPHQTGASRPSGAPRPSSGQRPAGQRPANGQRPSNGQRPANGQRPSGGQQRPRPTNGDNSNPRRPR